MHHRPGSATHQAREAAARADVIFACGGDGTVHEVLQGLVTETGTPACTLGIIPLGSATRSPVIWASRSIP